MDDDAPDATQADIKALAGGAALPEARLGRTRTGRKGRLSPQLKAVIELIAYEGEDLRGAAAKAGMNPDAARQAFARPHVKHALNQLIAEIRSGAGQAAYLRINKMSKEASSEAVRLDANRWIAGVDNIAPIKRVEGRFQHNHQFGGFAFPQVDDDVHTPSAQIDITPEEDQ